MGAFNAPDEFTSMFDDMPPLMTAKEVAGKLRLSHKTVFQWAADGKIPSFPLYGARRFPKLEVIEWLRQKKSGNRKQ